MLGFGFVYWGSWLSLASLVGDLKVIDPVVVRCLQLPPVASRASRQPASQPAKRWPILGESSMRQCGVTADSCVQRAVPTITATKLVDKAC